MSETYATHRRFVPGFHYGVFVGLTVNLAWALSRLGQSLSGDTVVGVILAASLIGLAIYARSFPLKAQDRVIRLEMLMRLRDVLPVAMHARIREFTLGQLIAMRFAGDAELPGLAAKVLQENIQSRDAIKQLIQQWQPDTHRV